MTKSATQISKLICAISLLCGSGRAYAQNIAFPADISGLAFHIDAHDITGTGNQPANGALINMWNDLSANAYHISATANLQPSFEPTGFDGLRPAVRFHPDDRMFGPDILPTVAGQMTIFFVSNNVNQTRNFSVSLNGNNTSGSTRYSFHTPWTDDRVYFDAGAATGANRVNAIQPTPFTETTIYTAWNDLAGSEQAVSVDGTIIASDNSGHDADSSRGIHLGTVSDRTYDGRFGELIVYNEVLSPADRRAVEQYLFCKWKPASASEQCARIEAAKTVQIQSSPQGDYSLPSSIVRYTIEASNAGPFAADSGSVEIIDAIPQNTILKVSDIGAIGSGPVIFTDGSPSSNMSYNYITLSSSADDVDFSNDGGVNFTYTPIPDGLGLDDAVTHIRISPSNPFAAGTDADPSNFSIAFDVYLK